MERRRFLTALTAASGAASSFFAGRAEARASSKAGPEATAPESWPRPARLSFFSRSLPNRRPCSGGSLGLGGIRAGEAKPARFGRRILPGACARMGTQPVGLRLADGQWRGAPMSGSYPRDL
jgi:hypothetical protein